jgi:hypothetical protein
MNASSDAGSDAVTVTCQASLGELRAATFWLYMHDWASLRANFLLIVVPAILIFMLFDRIAHNWSGFINQRWNYLSGRGVGAMVWIVAFVIHRVWQLWVLPARAWRRFQAEGPTTLTVSSSGLSWYNSRQRKEVGWEQYDGYVVLPDAIIFLSRVPYIVGRSTVSPFDFERVISIAQQHLQAVKQFDSLKGRISSASPAR